MDALDAIKLRRSIRKYKPIPVEWEKVSLILEAGKSAPTAGNLQNFKFIAVTKKDVIKQVSEACINQLWMSTAPVMIVVVAEPSKAVEFYGVRGERLYTVQNCATAAENMLIAATSLGLGSCWVGAFDENRLKEALDIPKTARPQCVITLGYAAEVVPEPMHYPLVNQVFLDSYGTRLMDPAAAMGLYSLITKRNVEKAKEKAVSTAETIKDKIKHHISKRIEDLKEKAKEKSYRSKEEKPKKWNEGKDKEQEQEEEFEEHEEDKYESSGRLKSDF